MNAWTVKQHRANKNIKSNELMDSSAVLNEFVENNTLPGVSQMFKRKHWAWKFFWLIVSLACASMAIFQSWPILIDFIEGKTIQSTSYSPEFDFPAITICSNIRLHHAYTHYFSERITEVNPDNLTSIIEFVEMVQQKRKEVDDIDFPTLKSFRPVQCTYNRKLCDLNDDSDLYNFQTALFGKCTTFNVGSSKAHRKIGRFNNNLIIKFKMDYRDRKLDFNENYLQLWLHPAGSAPVLFRSEGIRVYPGDNVDVRFEMKHIKRLPKRGNPCINPQHDWRRFHTIYYDNHTTYIYNTKACSYGLLFETKRAMYNCLDPAVPQNEAWEKLWSTNAYNICSPGNNMELPTDEGNETEFYSLFNFDSNCSLPCHEWMIEFTSTSTSAWFEAMIAESLRQAGERKQKSELRWSGDSVEIKVGVSSAMVELVAEDYKYQTGDFAGIIGGNIGFWVGLCAISLAELLELAVSLLTVTWRRLLGSPKKPRPARTKIIHVKNTHI